MVVERYLLELAGVGITFVGAMFDIQEIKKPAIVLTLAGTLLLFMSYYSPGKSLVFRRRR